MDSFSGFQQQNNPKALGEERRELPKGLNFSTMLNK